MKDYCVTLKSDEFVFFFVTADHVYLSDYYIYFSLNGITVCALDREKFYYE